MSDLAIDLHWQRSEPVFATGKYSAQHTVIYNNSYEVLADAAPDWGGRPENTNPEQALTAKAGWPVASDHDYAEAHLGKNPKGQMSVTRIDLHPVVRFDTGFSIADAELEQMQDRAHRYFFIAKTLADCVEINIL